MDLRGVAGCVHGIDPDPRVLANPYLDEARIGSGEAIPYPAATFDLVFSNNVLEHLESPAKVFREVTRVLRPGGRFLAKTPNARHYVPVVARFTSHWFHETVNRVRGRAEADTFPTLYRVNTEERIRHYAGLAGLDVVAIRMIEGRPEYLRFHPLAYLAGAIYERMVNQFEGLAGMRVLLIAVLRKPL